jgi:ribosomal protein L37AE/L43A
VEGDTYKGDFIVGISKCPECLKGILHEITFGFLECRNGCGAMFIGGD